MEQDAIWFILKIYVKFTLIGQFAYRGGISEISGENHQKTLRTQN